MVHSLPEAAQKTIHKEQKTIISNSYGRFRQTIIVHVEENHAQQTAARLGILPSKEEGEPVRAYFAWTRLTTRAGNDEDVVFDLALLLDGKSEQINWQIDWAASEY